WRENGGNAYKVLSGNAGVAQRQLKRCQPLAVFSDPLGEKNLLVDHVLGQFLYSSGVGCKKSESNTPTHQHNVNFSGKEEKLRRGSNAPASRDEWRVKLP